jgi:hypothetical protein
MEAARAVVRILVVTVPMANIALQPVNGEVHAAEADGGIHPLLAP